MRTAAALAAISLASLVLVLALFASGPPPRRAAPQGVAGAASPLPATPAPVGVGQGPPPEPTAAPTRPVPPWAGDPRPPELPPLPTARPALAGLPPWNTAALRPGERPSHAQVRSADAALLCLKDLARRERRPACPRDRELHRRLASLLGAGLARITALASDPPAWQRAPGPGRTVLLIARLTGHAAHGAARRVGLDPLSDALLVTLAPRGRGWTVERIEGCGLLAPAGRSSR